MVLGKKVSCVCRYSNHAHNAKNYGESFWVWDWMFGTTSLLVGKAAWKVQQQRQQQGEGKLL